MQSLTASKTMNAIRVHVFQYSIVHNTTITNKLGQVSH